MTSYRLRDVAAGVLAPPAGEESRRHLRGTIQLPADVAQLVERNLAKVEVAGSIPVVRSKGGSCRPFFGDVAEWLGKGLQNPLPGFDSRRRLRRYNRRHGRLAQWESASLTRKRSAVQSCQRPPTKPLLRRGFRRVDGRANRPLGAILGSHSPLERRGAGRTRHLRTGFGTYRSRSTF